MAKFKRGNLDLKTNQKIRLGDSLDSQIYNGGSSLTLINSNSNVYITTDDARLTTDGGTGFRATGTYATIHNPGNHNAAFRSEVDDTYIYIPEDSDPAIHIEKTALTLYNPNDPSEEALQIYDTNSNLRVILGRNDAAGSYLDINNDADTIVAYLQNVSVLDLQDATYRLGKVTGARLDLDTTNAWWKLYADANNYTQQDGAGAPFFVIEGGVNVFSLTDNIQRMGVTGDTTISLSQSANEITMGVGATNVVSLTTTSQTIGVASTDSNMIIDQASDFIGFYVDTDEKNYYQVMDIDGANNQVFIGDQADTHFRVGLGSSPSIRVMSGSDTWFSVSTSTQSLGSSSAGNANFIVSQSGPGQITSNIDGTQWLFADEIRKSFLHVDDRVLEFNDKDFTVYNKFNAEDQIEQNELSKAITPQYIRGQSDNSSFIKESTTFPTDLRDFGTFQFKGKIWIVGGHDGVGAVNTVYSSYDGIEWTLETSSAFSGDTGGLYAFGYCVFGGRMWVVGGVNGAPALSSSRYYSEDGINWTWEPTGAPSGAAVLGGQMLVYDGKMWFIGGDRDGSGTVTRNVYYSEAVIGATFWTLVAPGNTLPEGLAQFGHVVFDDYMWVFGGYGSGITPYSDRVYKSQDGDTWTQAGTLPSELRECPVIVYDNKLWLFGGVEDGSVSKQVHYSLDGTSWTQVSTDVLESAAGNPLTAFNRTIVHNGHIWMFCPWENTVGETDDIYYSVPGITPGLKVRGDLEVTGDLIISGDVQEQHNSLLGLQGGDSTANTEMYHLTQEVHDQISSDPTTIILSNDLDVSGGVAIGSAASPLSVASLYVNENFTAAAATYGAYISSENTSNFDIPFTATAGLGVSVQQNVSTLQNLVQGANISVNIAADNAVATTVTGVKGTAFVTADNTTITDMIGADFKVSPATSMSNAVVGSMIGGQFQILGAGSGDVDVTDGYGVLIQTPSFNSSGTTDNLYGLYIEDQSTVGFTTDYNLYSAGVNSKNKIEGSLEVDLIDSTALVVTGDIYANDLHVSGSSIHLGNTVLTGPSNDFQVSLNGSNRLSLGIANQIIGDQTDTWIDVGQSGGAGIDLWVASTDVGILTASLQRIGVSGANNIQINQSGNSVNIQAGGFLPVTITSTLQTIGNGTDTNMAVNQTANTIVFEANNDVKGTFSTTGFSVPDLTVTNSISLPEGSVEASDIDYAKVSGATYSTVQEGMDQLGSAGLIEGGIVTADGTAAVNVTAGSGMLRTSNDLHAPLVFVDFPETLSIAIPSDETRDIVVNYNSGTPIVEAVVVGSVNANTYFLLGEVGRADTELFISNLRQRISSFAIRSLARMYGTDAVLRNGNTGLILGESGDTNRYVTMTSGEVWSLLDLEVIGSFNSGTGDDFTTIYRDTPSGYVETPGETQWPADFYDDGSGTLAALSNNRYGVRWFWLIPSSDDLVMVYGTGNWKSLAEAEAEPVPTEVPNIITEFGVLIGKIIVLKSVNIAAEVSSAFEETYNFAAVTDHGNLSNLAAPFDDHTQYSHIDGRRDFTATVGGIDPVSTTDFVTLGYMSELGTGTQRLTYDSTTGDLDISIEHIVDVKYTDFDITEDAPPWQEGRVFWDKDNNTFGVYNDVADVTLQVGQETHVKIRNESGVLIPNGSLCYVAGSSQERALVELADASDQDKTEGLLMITHDLAHNTDGYGTIIGVVRGIDTIGYSDGDEVYLSDTTPGAFRLGRPTAPNYVVDVGFIITGDSTANGSILVSFINHGDFATLADVNIPTPPTNGQTLVYDEDNMYWSPETQAKVISYTLPLTGVVDTVVPLTGTFVTKASGVTGDDATDYAISNQHVWILINSVTGADSTGTLTITGTSLSESTALPVTSDTEVITIDSTAGTYYQTDKKWWEITNIAVSPDISAINYDHGALGYPDMGNRNFKILGYRMDAFAAGNAPDMRLIISKVHDVGEKVVEVVDLEDIGVDSGAAADQIIDHVRTGGSDRSFNPTVTDVWLNNETFTFKQLDFDTYWSNDENEILAAEGNSGYFIRIEGEPDGGGITNVDYVSLLLYYALL